MANASEYEVRCPACNVTFPKGTKVCLHCGGRTGPSLTAVPPAEGATAIDPSDPSRFELSVRQDAKPMMRPRPLDALSEEDREDSPRSGWGRSLGTLIWVLLAVGFSIVRACSDK